MARSCCLLLCSIQCYFLLCPKQPFLRAPEDAPKLCRVSTYCFAKMVYFLVVVLHLLVLHVQSFGFDSLLRGKGQNVSPNRKHHFTRLCGGSSFTEGAPLISELLLTHHLRTALQLLSTTQARWTDTKILSSVSTSRDKIAWTACYLTTTALQVQNKKVVYELRSLLRPICFHQLCSRSGEEKT